MPIIFGFLAFLLLSCEGKVEVPAKKPIKGPSSDQNPDSNNGDPKVPTQTGSEPTNPSEPNPEPSMPGWTLSSPANGSTSSDTSPTIRGTDLKISGESQATLYADSSCSQSLATATVNEDGNVEFSSRFSKEIKDGQKSFYVRIEAGKGEAECQDLKLGYTLSTDLPLAKTNAYRLTVSDDPSTKISIGFNASTKNSSEYKIFYDTDDHGRDVKSYAFQKSLDRNKAFLGMNNAWSRLSGLKPDTVYYFVVQDASGTSPTFSFRTLPNTPDQRLSIIAGGDSRNNRTPRKNANSLVAKLRPHVVMFGGDMTNLGTANEWKEWFEDWQSTIAEDGRMTAMIATRGNHESSNEILETLFDTPASVYYAMNIGGNLLRVYTLNTEASISGTQSTWLKNDLKTQGVNTNWRIAQYHVPMRPHVKDKAEGTSQYLNWSKAFYDYKMNIVVESDSHSVKSTWPLKPSTSSKAVEGFERDDSRGTIFLGEGCWGAPLRNADDIKSWTRDSGSFNHFNWMWIDKDQIEIKTIKVDNAKDVGRNSDADIFVVPENLDIWSPRNGSTIKVGKY